MGMRYTEGTWHGGSPGAAHGYRCVYHDTHAIRRDTPQTDFQKWEPAELSLTFLSEE